MTWQPIETAPKDQLIMLWRPQLLSCDIGKWDEDRYAKKPRPYWRSLSYILFTTRARAWTPTHWQPLPQPPTQPTTEADRANGSLGPAAQAVMDAYQSASDGCYVNGEWIQDHAGQIAAALRAVADQVVPEGGVFLSTAGAARIRRDLLAIVAELEGQALPQPPTPNPIHHQPMLKPDHWIREQAAQGMIEPFVPELVREILHGDDYGHQTNSFRVLSFGTSSYGYDLRLSPKEFLIFRHIPGTVMNPKRFNPANLEPAQLHQDEDGSFFILPAHSYGLGVALERLRIPPNITAICLGKSTYARLGIIANMTPAEAAWEGHLTLEFSNSSGADCRVYAGEGICQVLFLEGKPCEVSYADRAGKYQGQGESVVVARI